MNSRTSLEAKNQQLADSDTTQNNICRLEWISRAIAAAKKHPDAARLGSKPAAPTLKAVD